MSNLLIVSPAPIVAVSPSRGTGAANLLTPDPKEVWADNVSGGNFAIDVDLGVAQSIDTVLVGYTFGAAPDAAWLITGGVDAYDTVVLKGSGAFRAADGIGARPGIPQALWFGAAATVRYLRLVFLQPAGASMMKIGVIVAGKAFVPGLNKEWGSGRRLIDSGTATGLPSGGFAIVEGARKRAFSWTLGDLTTAEVEVLDGLALDRGETRPVLVVEDPAQTPGLSARIHYGLMRWKAFERRSYNRTKWELEVEEWV